MLTSLGFDTLVVHADRFYSDMHQALDAFYVLGIKNFLLVFDYDPLCDSISIIKNKMDNFKILCAKSASHRIKLKCALNLHLSQGAAFNDSLTRLYCNKASKTLLVSLPLFTDSNYEPIALDVNHLLYKKSVFPIFTSFEKIVESSSIEFCSKFINNPKIAISIDLNYLFNPQKEILFNKILNSNSLVLPSISKDISIYAGILSLAEFDIKKYGKKSYYSICSQINRTSSKLLF